MGCYSGALCECVHVCVALSPIHKLKLNYISPCEVLVQISYGLIWDSHNIEI